MVVAREAAKEAVWRKACIACGVSAEIAGTTQPTFADSDRLDALGYDVEPIWAASEAALTAIHEAWERASAAERAAEIVNALPGAEDIRDRAEAARRPAALFANHVTSQAYLTAMAQAIAALKACEEELRRLAAAPPATWIGVYNPADVVVCAGVAYPRHLIGWVADTYQRNSLEGGAPASVTLTDQVPELLPLASLQEHVASQLGEPEWVAGLGNSGVYGVYRSYAASLIGESPHDPMQAWARYAHVTMF